MEAVSAQHQRLAAGEYQVLHFDVDVGARADDAGQHVPHRVPDERAGGKPRFLLQQHDPRIVGRRLHELIGAADVDAAVAHPGIGDARALDERGHDRRAHPGVAGVLPGGAMNADVRQFHRRPQAVSRERQRRIHPEQPGDLVAAGGRLPEKALHRVDGHARRDLTGVVTAHAVGNRHQAEIRIPERDVFVHGTHRTGVSPRTYRQH